MTKKDLSYGKHFCTKTCLVQHRRNLHSNNVKYCAKCKRYKQTRENFRLTPSKQPSKRCIACEVEIKETKGFRKKIRDKHGVCYDTYERGLSPELFLKYSLKSTVRSCKALGREIAIDLPFLVDLFNSQKGICALSGEPLTWYSGRGRHASPQNISIDRIDSSKGYLKDNVHLVCYIVNLMKNNLTIDRFNFWCKAVLDNYARKNN